MNYKKLEQAKRNQICILVANVMQEYKKEWQNVKKDYAHKENTLFQELERHYSDIAFNFDLQLLDLFGLNYVTENAQNVQAMRDAMFIGIAQIFMQNNCTLLYAFEKYIDEFKQEHRQIWLENLNNILFKDACFSLVKNQFAQAVKIEVQGYIAKDLDIDIEFVEKVLYASLKGVAKNNANSGLMELSFAILEFLNSRILELYKKAFL